jgi:hypothetical protein
MSDIVDADTYGAGWCGRNGEAAAYKALSQELAEVLRGLGDPCLGCPRCCPVDNFCEAKLRYDNALARADAAGVLPKQEERSDGP